MIILKLIEKLILLPIWIILALISLCIKLTVNLYGFIKGVFTFLLILLMIGTIVCYQDWVQVAALLCIEAAAFLILFCGCFIEVTVDMLRGYVERQAFVLERRMNMAYIHEILGKANIRSVADFLLFGLGPDEDTRNYEERIDELYDKFEDAVKKYDPNPTSELLDLSNEISSETASVYTEIGLQMGILLVVDMAANLRREKGQYSIIRKSIMRQTNL